MHVALAGLCVIAGLTWLFIAIRAWTGARALPPLPDLPPDLTPPRVRVVIAARDEADRIAGSVRRLLDQQRVDLEIVLVDDRSSDDTAAHARDAAAGDPRLRIIRIDTLPERWLGKCHALHTGSLDLDRDWIAFVDADSWLTPDALARAIAYAQREHAHHVCLLPHVGDATLLGSAPLNMFIMAFLADAHRVNRDRPRAYVGVGAFNLLSRDAHAATRPHERLRLEVLDDFFLGRLVRAFGGRSRCASGFRDLEIHWVRDIPSLLRLFEKNQFAALGYSTPRAAFVVVLLTLLWATSLLAWTRFDALGYFASAGMLAAILAARAVASLHHWGWATAALSMLAAPPIGAFSIANSTIKCLARNGVRWRETHYPLPLLRNARKQLMHDLRSPPRGALLPPPRPSPSHSQRNHPPSPTVEPMLTQEPATDGAA